MEGTYQDGALIPCSKGFDMENNMLNLPYCLIWMKIKMGDFDKVSVFACEKLTLT